jgi:hypothetical protein
MPDRRLTWLAVATAASLFLPGQLQDAAAQSRGGSGTGSGTGSGSGAGSGVGAGSSSSVGRSTGSFSTAPASPATPGALPPSAIGAPAPQVAPVAPLSPPTTSTFLGSGGSTVTTPGGTTTTTNTPGGLSTTAPGAGATATFSGGGSSSSLTTGSVSPSEAEPSRPGGGAAGFQACMGFWDAGTHMSKREWAAACRRTEARLQSLQSELNAAARKSGPGAAKPNASRDRVSRTRTR